MQRQMTPNLNKAEGVLFQNIQKQNVLGFKVLLLMPF